MLIKLPYTLDAVNYNFDITTQQPQLFVSPDFETLTRVLDEFVDRMALKRGGVYGMTKAIESENTATLQLSSGLQISGIFSDMITFEEQPVFIKSNSPTALSFENKELEGHGKSYHAHGYSTPLGKLKNNNKALEDMGESELEELQLIPGNTVQLEFESGIVLKGRIKNILKRKAKNLLISFYDCHVQYQDQVLFQPDWGIFDMALGHRIDSAFSGPADPHAFGLKYPVPEEKTHKITHSKEALTLHELYAAVREIRESDKGHEKLVSIWQKLLTKYSKDWLLPLEILEILTRQNQNPELAAEIKSWLMHFKNEYSDHNNLINNGLKLI